LVCRQGHRGGGTSENSGCTPTRASLVPFTNIPYLPLFPRIRLTLKNPTRTVFSSSATRLFTEPPSFPTHLLQNSPHLAGTPFNVDIIRNHYAGGCLPWPDTAEWHPDLRIIEFKRGTQSSTTVQNTGASSAAYAKVQVVSVGPTDITSKLLSKLETETDQVRDSVGAHIKHFVFATNSKQSTMAYFPVSRRPTRAVNQDFFGTELLIKYKDIFDASSPLESSGDGYVFS